VDFLLACDREPFLLVEARSNDHVPSKALRKFQGVLGIPAVQLTSIGGGFRKHTAGDQQILVAPAWQWLARLP